MLTLEFHALKWWLEKMRWNIEGRYPLYEYEVLGFIKELTELTEREEEKG